MDATVETRVATAITGRQAKVLQVKPESQKTACILSEGGRVLVSNILASHIRPGDEIDFPLAVESAGAGTEIYVRRTSTSARTHDLYNAPLGYAAQPRTDKREQLYVRAEVLLDAWAAASCIFPVRCCGIIFTSLIGGCHGRSKRPSMKSCAVPPLPHRPSYAWPSNFVSLS